jgi:hypothetical protein
LESKGLDMGWNWVANIVKNPGKTLDDAGSTLSNVVQKTLNGVSGAVTTVLQTINKTVDNIIRDPLPTIAIYAGMSVGIPPFVTAAAITASRGGNVEDMMKSAAISWAVTKGLEYAEIGSTDTIDPETGEVVQKPMTTKDITRSIGEKIGSATTPAIGTAVASGLNTSIVAGIRASLTGKDVNQAIADGFASGSVSSGVTSLSSELGLQKDWGLSDKQMKTINATVSTGISAAISGKDPSTVIGNYIANTLIDTGATKVAKEAKDAYKSVQDLTSSAKVKADEYDAHYQDWTKQKEEVQKQVDEFNVTRTAYLDNYSKEMQPVVDKITPYTDAFNTAKTEYDKQMAIYNNTGQSIDARNAAGAEAEKQAKIANDAAVEANKIQTENKSVIDKYNTQNNSLAATAGTLKGKVDILNDYNLGAPTDANKEGSTAWKLYQSSEALQKTIDAQRAAVDAATAADLRYATQVSETTTQNITLDAIKNGTIAPISKPDGEAGVLYFDNGMELRQDGTIYQGGKQVYSSAMTPDVTDIFKGATPIEGANGRLTYTGTAGRDVAESDITRIKDIVAGKRPVDLAYDINQDNKVDKTDLGLITAMSQGASFNPTEEVQPWQFLGTSGQGMGDWQLTKEGYWVSPDGKMLDIEGKPIGYNATLTEQEAQPWENLSQSGDTQNMAGWTYSKGVWSDPSGNKFDQYGNFVGEKSATAKPYTGKVGTVWGPTGSMINRPAATNTTQTPQQQIDNTKAQLQMGIANLVPQIQALASEGNQQIQQPQVVGSGISPEFTNPIELGAPLETDYFSKLVKEQQDKKSTQTQDGTVKIASGGSIRGLPGLLRRRG